MGVHVAAVWPERREPVGMLEPQMPGPGGARRHAAQHDALPVDRVAVAPGFDRLEDVRLAGPPVAVLDPRERWKLDVVQIGAAGGGVVAVVEPLDEAQLAQAVGLLASVEDHVEPHRRRGIVARRHGSPYGWIESSIADRKPRTTLPFFVVQRRPGSSTRCRPRSRLLRT